VVQREHVEPDCIDFEIGVGISFKDVGLDPTGPCAANGSGWGEQQNEAGRALAAVENGLKFFNGTDVWQTGLLRALRAEDGGDAAEESNSEKDNDHYLGRCSF
jgi:hypothetical protein